MLKVRKTREPFIKVIGNCIYDAVAQVSVTDLVLPGLAASEPAAGLADFCHLSGFTFELRPLFGTYRRSRGIIGSLAIVGLGRLRAREGTDGTERRSILKICSFLIGVRLLTFCVACTAGR